jgi:HD-like signal output (HDOD) protein
MNQVTTSNTQPLTESVRRLVDSGKTALPPLPSLVNRLITLLRDEHNVSSTQVARLVETDPAVAATLLKWANSAAFGGLMPISSLSTAIARLGFREVTSAVTAIAHGAHFQSGDPVKAGLLETLWGHAVAVALTSKRIAHLIGGDPEEAFVAGLLHDTGKLLVLRAVDHLEARDHSEITPVVLDELMNVLHCELGHGVLTSWSVPEPICTAALHHHDEAPPAQQRLVIHVQAADEVARKMGFHIHADPDMDLLGLPSVERLNLTDLELATMMVDLEDDIADIKRLL